MASPKTRCVRYLARPSADAIADRAADRNPGSAADGAAGLDSDRNPGTDHNNDAVGHHDADRYASIAGGAYSTIGASHTHADPRWRRADCGAAHANGNTKAVMRVMSDA